MLQALSTATVISPALPDSVKDDDPPQRATVEIIEFENYRRLQSANAKSLNEIIYFPITIDESLSAEAQNIVNRSCGDSVSSLKVEPLLRKHQLKIWITVKAAAYGIVLHAIILGLPSAELGPVVRISAALHG